MSYSVQIANIYELLNEDDAPVVKTQAKDTKAAPTKGSTQAKAPAKQTQAPQKTQPKDNQQKQTRPPRQDRPPRQRNDSGEVVTASPKESHERQGTERRDKGASYQTGSRRVYDRKPGTGRGREFKKGGGGKANWGKEGEEQPTAPETEEGKEKTEEKTEEKKEEKVEETKVEEPVEEEEEDKTITYEEYLKKKEAEAAAKFQLPEARKANEGVDKKELNKWQQYTALKRDEEEEVKSTETSEKKEKKPKKTVVPLDQIFDVKTPPISTPRGRGRGRGRGGSNRGENREENRGENREYREGNRGGRGGNRGGRGGNRGRGGARGGQGGAEIKMDESSFPSLAPTKA